MLEFNEEFYNRVLSLLMSTHSSAATELKKLHEEILKTYDARGWIDADVKAKLNQKEPLKWPIKKVLPDDLDAILLNPQPSPSGESAGSSKGVSVIQKTGNKNAEGVPDSKAHTSTPKMVDIDLLFDSSGPDVPKAAKIKEEISSSRSMSSTESEATTPLDFSVNNFSEIKSKKKLKSTHGGGSGTAGHETEFEAKKPRLSRDSAPQADIAMELGLACSVCHRSTFDKDNAFVECHDCHQSFHQKCHEPPIPDSQAADPRVVWSCRSCTKKSAAVKKLAMAKHQKLPGGNGSSSASSTKDNPTQKPQHSSEQKPKGNIANLAASFLAKHKAGASPAGLHKKVVDSGSSHLKPLIPQAIPVEASSASHVIKRVPPTYQAHPTVPQKKFPESQNRVRPGIPSSSGSGSSSGSCPPMASADKRLQLMKKKAAAKNVERKLLPK